MNKFIIINEIVWVVHINLSNNFIAKQNQAVSSFFYSLKGISRSCPSTFIYLICFLFIFSTLFLYYSFLRFLYSVNSWQITAFMRNIILPKPYSSLSDLAIASYKFLIWSYFFPAENIDFRVNLPALSFSTSYFEFLLSFYIFSFVS